MGRVTRGMALLLLGALVGSACRAPSVTDRPRRRIPEPVPRVSVSERLQDGSREPVERTIWEADERGLPLVALHYAWRDGAWVPVRRVTTSYDGEGRDVGELTEVLSVEGAWEPQGRVELQRGAAGLVEEGRAWACEAGEWVLVQRREVRYDPATRELADVVFVPDGRRWQQEARTVHTFDEHDQRLATTTSRYVNARWEPVQRVYYAYDGAGLLSGRQRQGWKDGSWVDTDRTDLLRDGVGRLVEERQEVWRDGAWILDLVTTHSWGNAGG